MKRIVLCFICLTFAIVANADAVEIDGIYYNLVTKAKVAEVTWNPNRYKNSIDIPPTVIYNGIEYNVTSIGERAFEEDYDLTSVTIPNSVTSIGNNAFRYCTGLTSITIPNSVTSIGEKAFEATSLTSVIISDLVSWCKISFADSRANPLLSAHHLFLNNAEITDLVIPNSITSIKKNAFVGCTALTSISIPNSVTSIGEGAFLKCSGLTSVNIPNSVISIGEHAFNQCSGLKSITLPNGITKISPYTFFVCRSLTSLTIPNTVISIGYNAFQECTSLTSVTIPNSVKSIGDYAFESCSAIKTLSIGTGVQGIYKQTFANCPEITDVYCFAANVPITNNTAFDGSYPGYATLHVPEGSLESYKVSEPWSNFGTIMTIEGGDIIETPKCATPTIFYGGKRLLFDCDTEGVEYVSEIKVTDGKKYYNNSITLEATYEISVYATKAGYANSDVATATLVWTNAIFTDTTPLPEISTSAKSFMENLPVLISSHSGNITVNSEADGQKVEVYAVNGQSLGSAIVKNGLATISTKLGKGSVAIIKIGEKSVKIVMQ